MKIFKLILLFVFFISGCFHLQSQVLQEWTQRYAGAIDSSDRGVQIACDAAGSVYVLALSQGSMTRTDFALIKYSSAGAQQWVQRYNSPGNGYDTPVDMVLDAAGNIYVTGYSLISGILNYDITTIKYNISGSLQWVKTYNGTASAEDRPSGIAVDPSGNVYVTGYTNSTGSSDDYITIKYNSSGTEEWVKKYNGPGNGSDKAVGLVLDNSGNICISGYSPGSGTGLDIATIKYNPAGTELWLKRYTAAGSNNEFARAIANDPQGNIYVTGSATVGFNRDYLTIKYNSLGDTLWTKKYDGPDADTDEAYYIAVHDTNNIYISGYSYSSSTAEDIATVKYNSMGVQQWAIRYDGPGGDGSSGPRGLQEDFVSGIALDNSGSVYITGTAYFITGLHDYITIKYDPSGVQKWIQTYNGQSNDDDGAFSIALDNSGNVFVTGYSVFSAANNDDCVTIKYSQPIGISNISNEIPSVYSLSQNYPNPFNPATNIKFSIPVPGNVKLIVFDMLGREIKTLVNGNLNARTYSAYWDASQFSSGIYFYRIEAGPFSETGKMILVK
jgi:uncharacterized delta-60 repeat protein